MSACCAESVHSAVCHCARVAQVITVGSGAHVQAAIQWDDQDHGAVGVVLMPDSRFDSQDKCPTT